MKITKKLLEELISEAFKNLDESDRIEDHVPYPGEGMDLRKDYPLDLGLVGDDPPKPGGETKSQRDRRIAKKKSQGGTKLDYDPSKSPLSSSPPDAATSAVAALGMPPEKIKTGTDLRKSLRNLASDPKVFQGIQAAEFGEIIKAFLSMVDYAKIANANTGPVKNAMVRAQLMIDKAKKQASATKLTVEPTAKPGNKLPGKTTERPKYPTAAGGKQVGASGELEDIPHPDIARGLDQDDPTARAAIPAWRRALNKMLKNRNKAPMEEVKVSLTEDEIKLIKRLTNKK